jgi:WXG100 family type VII secretion target
MAEIKVTPQVLRQKAEELRNYNAQFRAEVQKMIGYEAQLASMWEGTAQQAFRRAFNTDRAKMDLFAQNIDTYIQALLTDAQRYESAENATTNIATTRRC